MLSSILRSTSRTSGLAALRVGSRVDVRPPLLSAVVLHELLRGVRKPVERLFVRDLQRHCRIVTPTERHWIEAAEILAQVRERERYDVSKARDLAFDVLIALSARSIGATLVTVTRPTSG